MDGFEQIFGEARASDSSPSRRILFRLYASDPRHLTTCVTDFRSTFTWQAVQSLEQLHQLKDDIGIAGTWLDFFDYLTSSFQSGDVKFIVKTPKSDGLVSANLVAQKSKGMPLVSVALCKLVDIDAVEAIANFSVQLFDDYRCVKELILKGEGSSSQSVYERQVEAGDLKLHSHQQGKHNTRDGNDKLDSLPTRGLEMSPEKAPTRTKVNNPVVPAYRRVKKRGAILQDSEAQ